MCEGHRKCRRIVRKVPGPERGLPKLRALFFFLQSRQLYLKNISNTLTNVTIHRPTIIDLAAVRFQLPLDGEQLALIKHQLVEC